MSDQKLPQSQTFHSTSTVTSADVDNDGDIDLFVGERVIPSQYGVKGSGYLLLNDGKGQFIDSSKELAPELLKIGMITDAQFLDLDNDKDQDLVVVGEFMSVTFFKMKTENLAKS